VIQKFQKRRYAGKKILACCCKVDREQGGHCRCPGLPKYANACAKAFYVKREGPGLEKMDVEHELNKMANFGALENPRKIASRLELMITPAVWAPSKKFAYQFALKVSAFEESPEQGNDGCGFFPKTFFDDRLGITDPSSVCAPSAGLCPEAWILHEWTWYDRSGSTA
jgi:hypothetical protein